MVESKPDSLEQFVGFLNDNKSFTDALMFEISLYIMPQCKCYFFQVEGQLQEEWQLLTRDIYAFYPLLIKYVDQQRNYWLKNDVPEAEDVYNRVAQIFHIWSNSQVIIHSCTVYLTAEPVFLYHFSITAVTSVPGVHNT